MSQSIGQVAILVRDYDEALAFTSVFSDSKSSKTGRFRRKVSDGSSWRRRLSGLAVCCSRAVGDEHAVRIGNQTGGRVFPCLITDDFWRDFQAYQENGVVFVRGPTGEPYGTVAVFEDLYGNLWDLLQSRAPEAMIPDAREGSTLEVG